MNDTHECSRCKKFSTKACPGSPTLCTSFEKAPMKVYPVQHSLHGMPTDEDEVIAVCSTLEAAKSFVERRDGLSEKALWTQHHGHGVCWTLNVSFQINAGPSLVNHYTITEHEVLP
ncbi:MAG: hypothetical protein KJ648_07620 [Candidatus Omnitrophica bacterium]|nr:hypothetical protein [Candidatus Omnitrophota bacterium]